MSVEGVESAVEERRYELVVTVSEDGLQAMLEVRSTAETEAEQPTVDDALAALTQARVHFGVDGRRVALALEHPGTAVVVADGRPPVPGLDGAVTYAERLLAVSGRPRVDDDGQVSLFDLGLVRNVAEGEVLATRTPPTPGEPGTNVRGEPITPKPGKPAVVRAASGARISEDGSQVLAAVAGHAVLVGNTVSVSSVFHVRGDVGPATGHVDFVGSVRIGGNVQRGYRVKAGGDVEIEATMASGEVEAGGNVSVRYGIQGKDGEGSVTAAGTVRAKFIEFATVRAGGNVYASDGIVNSVVEAGAAVEVLGIHGSVIGGSVTARELVKAREMGSVRGIATEVHVGADPALLAEAQQVQAVAAEMTQRLARIQASLAQLQQAHRQGHLNALGRHQLVESHEAYRTLLEERADVAKRQQELVELLRALPAATVVVEGTCYAGVRVSIGGATHAVKDGWRGVRFQRNAETRAVELVGTSTAH